MRLRADELELAKGYAEEDDWELSSWLYLLVQRGLAEERRKRRRGRRAHDRTPD